MRKGFLWLKKIIAIVVAMFCFLLCAIPAFAYSPDSTYFDITSDGVTITPTTVSTQISGASLNLSSGQLGYYFSTANSIQTYFNDNFNSSKYDNTNIFTDVKTVQTIVAAGFFNNSSSYNGTAYTEYSIDVDPAGGSFTNLHGIFLAATAGTYVNQTFGFVTDKGFLPVSFTHTYNKVWTDYSIPASNNLSINEITGFRVNPSYYAGISRIGLSRSSYIPPPIPPNPPVGHDFPSFTSFEVPLSAGNTSFIYYEDIVNAFYSKSIDEKVLSHSYYPYITLQCVSTNSNNYIFVYFSDSPAVTNASIDTNGNYTRPVTTGNSGLSGLAFVGYYPISAPAGYDVEFIATSAYSGMGIQEIQTALSTSQPITIYDGHTLTGYVDLADIGSYENASASMYNICSNYSLTPNYLPETVASNIKQSFKYPESWARLCLVAIEDDITGQAADRIAELMEELATYRDELLQTHEEFQQSVEDLKTILEGNMTGSLSSADVASIGTVLGSIMFMAGPLMPILTSVFLMLVVMIIIKKGHG